MRAGDWVFGRLEHPVVDVELDPVGSASVRTVAAVELLPGVLIGGFGGPIPTRKCPASQGCFQLGALLQHGCALKLPDVVVIEVH